MSEIYQFGPFRLDADKLRLWRGDELVSVTPKALETLRVLVSRAGQLVEKDDLLKAVWPDTFVEEGTLAQNISTLRKVLGDTSERPTYIATIPRRGYRFIETASRLGPVAPPPAVTRSDGRTSFEVGAMDAPPVPQPAWFRAPSAGRIPLPLWVGLLIAGGLFVIAATQHAPRTTKEGSTRVAFTISPPAGTRLSTSGGFVAVSPDGRYIAFTAFGPDRSDHLWLRRLDSADATEVAATDDAWQPFWSADSRFIAFFAHGKLKRVGVDGQPPQTICDLPRGQPRTGTWNGAGDILFPIGHQAIYRVSADGGIPAQLTLETEEDSEAGWPQFLPDNRHFLYRVRSSRAGLAEILVGSLDGNASVPVIATESHAAYVSPGYLLFVEHGMLWTQPFDLPSLQVKPPKVPIAEGVELNAGTGRGVFSVSQTGVLAYRRTSDSQLAWFDQAGHALGTVGPPGTYREFSVSPDGTQVAAARLESNAGTSDIWVFSSDGGERRLTSNSSWDVSPLWSRDGHRVAFTSNRTGRWAIYERDVRQAAPDQLLVDPQGSADPHPQVWIGDGQLLLHTKDASTRGFWLASVARDVALVKLAAAQPGDGAARVSPDGRRLAFESLESGGVAAVYVAPVDAPAARTMVSPSGGSGPRWRADGRQLFYLAPDLTLMAVDIDSEDGFRLGVPHAVFQTNAVAPTGLSGEAFDVAPDGKRFLVKVPASPSPITVVVNWLALPAAR